MATAFSQIKKRYGIGSPASKGAGSQNGGGKSLWVRAKTFFTSPEGIVTIIVLAILVHYAWKGHKGEKAKS